MKTLHLVVILIILPLIYSSTLKSLHNKNDNLKPNVDNLLTLASFAFMEACDKNHDKTVSESELKNCFKALKNQLKIAELTMENFLDAFDLNADGLVTPEEYVSGLRAAFESPDNRKHASSTSLGKDKQTVELKTRDGKVRDVSLSELFDAMSANQGSASVDSNGNYFRESSGQASLESLEKDNPALARFIAVGRWCFDSMVPMLGVPSARMKNVRSSTPPPGPHSSEPHSAPGSQDLSKILSESGSEVSVLIHLHLYFIFILALPSCG